MADPIYSFELFDIQEHFKTDLQNGLTDDEAGERLSRYGPNVLPERPRPSRVMMFLVQFNDFLIYILIFALVISGLLLREYVDAVAIFVILILNAVLGFVQEYRAEQAMEALKELAAPSAMVIRSGRERQVKARDLVPGDLIVLEPGTSIPADAHLVEAFNVSASEAALTGESEPSNKRTGVVNQEGLSPGDIFNTVFMGTYIANGHGKAIIVSTGSDTEMGKIAKMLQDVETEKTPLQKELAVVGRRIGTISLAAAVIVFLAGIIREFPVAEMLLSSVSLAVAAVPEALPAVVTISLALGLQTMARKKAIIRRLHSVETLGSTTAICSDKTGTLTRNIMSAEILVVDRDRRVAAAELSRSKDDISLRRLLTVASLCNDARPGQEGMVLGDPTESALLTASALGGVGVAALRHGAPRVDEMSFDSERKRMTTYHETNQVLDDLFATRGHVLSLTKGAPEIIISRCDWIIVSGQLLPVNSDTREQLATISTDLAQQAFRTIGFAYKVLDGQEPGRRENAEEGMVFVGLAALADPPRPEVYAALELCRQASIKVYMVTGDHKNTAEAVGREIGLLVGDQQVMTGTDLENIEIDELARQIENISVFARVAPSHKVKIIDALKLRGDIVAMTGDGVNDAPAIKRADIGISMGLTGTDVTKEASDMILADDNFATIVAAIHEGRAIFDNIKKFILFLLSCNISEVLTMFVALVAGLPLPLLPIQILWINLITDSLPALALGVDPAEPDIMTRRPRNPSEGVLSAQRQWYMVWQGLILGAGALGAFVTALRFTDPIHAQTITFTTLVLVQKLHAFNFRSRFKSVFSVESLRNKFLLFSFLLTFVLHSAILLTPSLREIFSTVLPTWIDLTIIGFFSLAPIALIDYIKRLTKTASF